MTLKAKTLSSNIRNGSVATVPNSPIGGPWKKDWSNFGPRLGVVVQLDLKLIF